METRAFENMDLEVRADGDGRTICGILVPYNVEQRIHASLTEVFRKGAFADVIRAAHRVKLLSGHETRKFPLGRATMLREDEGGLYGELKINNTVHKGHYEYFINSKSVLFHRLFRPTDL